MMAMDMYTNGLSLSLDLYAVLCLFSLLLMLATKDLLGLDPHKCTYWRSYTSQNKHSAYMKLFLKLEKTNRMRIIIGLVNQISFLYSCTNVRRSIEKIFFFEFVRLSSQAEAMSIIVVYYIGTT